MSAESEIAGVRLTHPDKILYPDQGVTKLELARYYEAVAGRILPFVADRPLSIVRCPGGQGGKCFYQKHMTDSLPDELDSVEIRERDGRAPYIVVRNLAGLIALVQIGTLEIHPWSCRTDDVEKPDMIVMDLDPAPDVAWSEVVKGARELRDRFNEQGLESFVRTTGGKGLHVVCPVERSTGWDELNAFARRVAERLAETQPERYLTQAGKAKRKGKIFVDYLRNSRGATAIASYSTRSRRGATVATPLRWDEIGNLDDGAAYNVKSVLRRLQALEADPWDGFFETRQSIGEAGARSS